MSATVIDPTKPEPTSKIIKMGKEEYEVISSPVVAASSALVKTWEKLGKPTDPFSDHGEKLMYVIIAIWEDLSPEESKMWYRDREEYKKAELSINEQRSKKTGRSLASYPYLIYKMMRKVFPTFKPAEKENAKKMCRKFPMFQFCNRI